MEYIREMLLRQRTALGRLMLGGGSAEEPETAAASPATERTSPAAQNLRRNKPAKKSSPN